MLVNLPLFRPDSDVGRRGEARTKEIHLLRACSFVGTRLRTGLLSGRRRCSMHGVKRPRPPKVNHTVRRGAGVHLRFRGLLTYTAASQHFTTRYLVF